MSLADCAGWRQRVSVEDDVDEAKEFTPTSVGVNSLMKLCRRTVRGGHRGYSIHYQAMGARGLVEQYQ